MMTYSNQTAEKLLGLHWLLRLRWIAVFGLSVVCLVTVYVLQFRLPVGVLAGCIGFIALSNAAAVCFGQHVRSRESSVMPLVLGFDILVLTIMLYFAGGAHNPFTMFYLLHITMAVILLPSWGAWGSVALCTAGFWSLFQSPHALESPSSATCCNDMTTHLHGMVVAMVLTGCGVAYFVGHLAGGLRESRHMIALARADGENARRTMEVANLAAGIAHELATPLGTIAIVSQDLETQANGGCGNTGCIGDARVIRLEVERCRMIIEKLGQTKQTTEEDSKSLDWNQLGELLSGYLSEPVRERLEVRLRTSPKRPLMPHSRLLQCLAILVKNGVEASPPETPVILDAEICSKTCIFRVMDQGEGFPPGFEKRIGEPFISTKSKNGGLGLGLYLVKAFVAERGGELRVESGPHGETMVVMQMPFVEQGA